MRFISAILLLSLFFSCKEKKQTLDDKQKEIVVGKLNSSNVYTVKEIGWTTVLPEGWEVIAREELKAITEKGKKEMEKTIQQKIDDSGVIELISIKKNMFNSMLSSMEKFEPDFELSYDDRIVAVNELLRATYRSKGMKFEDKVAATRIGGIMFDVIDLKIYAPGSDTKVLLYQSIYSALINGYDFSININYNNNVDKEILKGVVNGSKFSIK